MKGPIVSIIIPVYNVADYVTECLESVFTQTYRELEVILIDDRGNDTSMQIVRDFLERKRWQTAYRIITHEKNRGLSAARNTGIHYATGDYMYFLDSDDKLVSDCIESLVRCATKYPGCDFVQAGALVNSPKFNWLNVETWPMEDDFSNNRQWIQETMLKRLGCIPVTVWNKLIKSDFIKRNKLFFREGLTHEDELWHFQAARQTREVAFCRHNTYFYNIREGSITTRESKQDQMRIWVTIFDGMLDLLNPGENSIFTAWIRKHIYTMLYYLELDWVKEEQDRLNERLTEIMNGGSSRSEQDE